MAIRVEAGRPSVYWLVGIAAFALISRYASLTREFISGDEGTFMLLAQDALRGYLPYVNLFDNKPPGIFFAVAAAMRCFGESLAVVRLFGGVCAAVCGCLAFLICRRFAGITASGVAAALMLAAASNSFGQFAASEWPALVLLEGGLLLMLRFGENRWSTVAAGFCISLAVLFRTNIAIVAVATGLLYLVALRHRDLRLHRWGAPFYGLGAVVPMAALAAVYGLADRLLLLWLSAVIVPLSYAGGQHSIAYNVLTLLSDVFSAAFTLPGGFAPFAVLTGFGAVIWRRRFRTALTATVERRDGVIVLAVFAAVFVSVLCGGVFYAHYFLLLMPFMAVATAICLDEVRFSLRSIRYVVAIVGLSLTVVYFLPRAGEMLFFPEKIADGYHIRKAAGAIAADRQPGQVWATKYNLIYFYLHALPPTPLAAQPDSIVRPSIVAPLIAAGRASHDEYGRILQMAPRYIVGEAKGNPPYVPDYIHGGQAAAYAKLIRERYNLWFRDGPVAVYRRK